MGRSCSSRSGAGQMGERVGEARLRPQLSAAAGRRRCAPARNNLAAEQERVQLEAQNLKAPRGSRARRRTHRWAAVVIIRQASESGSLYGSVSARDISDACTAGGLTVTRQQVVLERSNCWACRACAWCCTPRCRSRSPSTAIRRKKPRSRRAARLSAARRKKKRRPGPRPSSTLARRPSQRHYSVIAVTLTRG